MNTVKSFWLGWGTLCVAGGGAYFFAKRSINADRQARWEEQKRKRTMIESLEYSSDNVPTHPGSASAMGGSSTYNGNGNNNGSDADGGAPRTDTVGSPSQESNNDPAPTRHAPLTEGQRIAEKSKYESAAPFRSPKGDRFS